MSDLSEKIINKIKEEHIVPRPRWQCLLKAYLPWLSGLVALLIGAGAVSVIIHILRFNDWDLYRYINGSLFNFTLLTLPYFWIIFLIIFALIMQYNLRHTKKGYKYPLPVILAAVIGLSMLGGVFLYAAGIGLKIDNTLSENIPGYTRLMNKRQMMWMKPAEGRLAGLVFAIENDQSFRILDAGGKNWLVFYREAEVHPFAKIEINSRLRLIGEERFNIPETERAFEAVLVFPAFHLGPHSENMPYSETCPMEMMNNPKNGCKKIIDSAY
jgi:hypothetical protein